jgi:hypothetical protein
VSSNRDIEADLLFVVGAFDRLALEYLAHMGATPDECRAKSAAVLGFAKQLTSDFGRILDSARHEGLRVSIHDPRTGTKRRLQLRDLPSFETWTKRRESAEESELTTQMGDVLGWSAGDRVGIVQRILEGSQKLCRAHQAAKCRSCTPRRFSNGHDLVDVLSGVFSTEAGFLVSEAEFSRALRVAAPTDQLSSWDVARRIQAWQEGHQAA